MFFLRMWATSVVVFFVVGLYGLMTDRPFAGWCLGYACVSVAVAAGGIALVMIWFSPS
jgi:hypothetical protein